MLQIERRFVKGCQLRKKSGDTSGIEGYASVFDQQFDNGWFVETIKPGAFTRALNEKQDVRCLFNHCPDNLLGRSKSGTLRMSEDSAGLHFDCDTDAETRVGADVIRMIERGDLDGCSFAFVVRKATWREEKDDKGETTDYRDIEDVDLYDVGPVTYPAYEGTSVCARSLWPEGVPAEVRSHVPGLNDPKDSKRERRADECSCPCGNCQDGDCANCNCDGCDSDNCNNEDCRCDEADRSSRRHAEMRLRLAEAENF